MPRIITVKSALEIREIIVFEEFARRFLHGHDKHECGTCEFNTSGLSTIENLSESCRGRKLCEDRGGESRCVGCPSPWEGQGGRVAQSGPCYGLGMAVTMWVAVRLAAERRSPCGQSSEPEPAPAGRTRTAFGPPRQTVNQRRGSAGARSPGRGLGPDIYRLRANT